MPEYAEKYRYTDGSLAYDFSRPELYPEFTLDEPLDGTAPEVREEAVPAAMPRTRQSVAPGALIGFACAAILLVFALLSHIQLTAVSDEAARLEKKITQLKEDEAKLLIAYESAFNLTEIENYAILELGMQKPTNDQIFYVDSSAPDKSVIFEKNSKGGGLWDSMGDLFSSLSEYFG